MRKKLTPLQKISLKERGTTSTSVKEELESGFTALGYLRQKNDPKICEMLAVYATLATKVKSSQGREKLKYQNEFKTVSDKMFRYAHKIGAFEDTRVAAGAFLQAIEYLFANPNGKDANIAISLIKELDKTPRSLGNIPNSSTSVSPWLTFLFIFLIFKLITGRSV